MPSYADAGKPVYIHKNAHILLVWPPFFFVSMPLLSINMISPGSMNFLILNPRFGNAQVSLVIAVSFSFSPIISGVTPFLSLAAYIPSFVNKSREVEPCILFCIFSIPSRIESPWFIRLATSSVPFMSPFGISLNETPFLISSSDNSFLFVMRPEQHIAKTPNLLLKLSGCGSLSEITPIPMLVFIFSEPTQNFDLNCEFEMSLIFFMGCPFSSINAIPPYPVPRWLW